MDPLESPMIDQPLPPFVDIHEEVHAALVACRPVVALESTIITHGMPFPQNGEMAERVEAVIRATGATPATIAVIDGRLRIGIDAHTRSALAEARAPLKLSRADLAHAVATGGTGGTTVAATMIAANLAGIAVFATGGIGGVHRGAAESFDISADIEELARTPVIVVSAGPKAILDIQKTLEVLETKGVPVIGFGTGQVPAFWSPSSGCQAPIRYDKAVQVARFHATRKALGISGGMLVTNPVPASHAINAQTMAAHVDKALDLAAKDGITGKAVTPYLLDQIFRLTGGASLAANIALVENNARLAAEIAKAVSANP
jgi:pseudouridine-5'-phosphate glycosidase